MRSQRTCVRHDTPLINTTNRKRAPGLRASKNKGACVTSLTRDFMLLPHTCRVTLSPQPARSRDHGFLDPETHLCATTNVRTSHKHRLRHRGLSSPVHLQHTSGCTHAQSEHKPGNWKCDHGFHASATHTCVCAQSLTTPGFSACATNVRACACVYVCLHAKKRHAAKSQQHPFPQYTCVHASATHICEVTHTHTRISQK